MIVDVKERSELFMCACNSFSESTQARIVKRVRVRAQVRVQVRNRNLTVIKSLNLIPVMSQSPTEVKIQNLNQTIVTQMHQAHHLDSTFVYHAFSFIRLIPSPSQLFQCHP